MYLYIYIYIISFESMNNMALQRYFKTLALIAESLIVPSAFWVGDPIISTTLRASDPTGIGEDHVGVVSLSHQHLLMTPLAVSTSGWSILEYFWWHYVPSRKTMLVAELALPYGSSAHACFALRAD